MKLVSYNPNEIQNIAEFFNKYLDEYSEEDYVMFIYSDIEAAVKDKVAFIDAYRSLMKELNIPFCFFPYYLNFNRILVDVLRKPVPRAVVNHNNMKFDIIGAPGFGMLMLDIQKLKGISFRFDEQYKLAFYIQDLINKCNEFGLYFSSYFFLDVHNSFDLFNSDFGDGYSFDMKKFIEEKTLFFNNNKPKEYEPINTFVLNLKKKLNGESIVVEEQKESK